MVSGVFFGKIEKFSKKDVDKPPFVSNTISMKTAVDIFKSNRPVKEATVVAYLLSTAGQRVNAVVSFYFTGSMGW